MSERFREPTNDGLSMSNVSRLILLLFVFLFASFPCNTQDIEVTLEVSPKEIRVVDGSRAYLFCFANVLNREIHWSFNSSRVKRTRNLQKGKFSVLSLQPARKRTDEGLYQCHISVGNDVISSEVINLEIMSYNKIPVGFPNITEKMIGRTFEKGTTAIMPCRAEGKPQPHVAWFRSELPLGMDDPRIDILPSGSLVISNATESDMENYFCSATNEHGVAFSASANLFVKERVIPPYFFIKPESRLITTGQKVNVTCVAAGSPTPQVYFIRDSKPNEILASGIRKVDLNLGSVVTSLNLSCIANSSHGQIREYFKISISDEIIATPMNLKAEQLSPYSTRVSWTCATQDHVIFIIKFKVITDSSPHQVVSTSGNHVVLTSLMPSSYYDLYVITRRDRDESSPAYLRFQTLNENNIVLSSSVYLKSRESVLLTWTSNYTSHQVFKEFVVKYGPAVSPTQESIVKSNNNFMTLGPLAENKEYRFSVTPILISENELKPVIADINIPSRNFNFKAPEKPVNLQHEVSEHLLISWSSRDDSTSESLQDHVVVYCKLSTLGKDYCQADHTYSSQRSHEVAGLLANASYSLKVAGVRGRVVSDFSDEIIFQTFMYEIKDLSTEPLSSTSISVTWAFPHYISNDLKSSLVLKYNSAPLDAAEGPTNTLKVNSADGKFILKNLQKFRRYRIRLASSNGQLVSRIAYETTSEDAPETPTGLRVSVLNSTSALVTWDGAGEWKANGQIIGYSLELYESHSDGRTDSVSRVDIRNGSSTEYLLTNLNSNVDYFVRVSALTKAGEGASALSKEFKAKNVNKVLSTTPKLLNDFEILVPVSTAIAKAENMKKLKAPVILDKTENSVKFRLYPDTTEISTDASREESEFLLVGLDSALANKRTPDSFTINELESRDENSLYWVAGKFQPIQLPMDYSIAEKFINLQEKTYNFFLIEVKDSKITSVSNYSETVGEIDLQRALGEEKSKGSDISVFLIVIPICIAILTLLFIILAIVCVRKRMALKKSDYKFPLKHENFYDQHRGLIKKSSGTDSNKLTSQQPILLGNTSKPILLLQMAWHLENLKSKDREGYRLEYESIDPCQEVTWEASNLEVNKPKNRYTNVVTYDHSRVILESIPGQHGSDYINANFIDGYYKRQAYIATQSPIPETFCDFWRMIWEYQCPVIVMVTKLEERNRAKCDQYWPARGSEIYGSIQVILKEVTELSAFTIRTFCISKCNFLETREATQIQFTAWPEHGVPDHPALFLQFVRRVRSASRTEKGPTVVHCRTGVGRTGVYIAVDSAYECLRLQPAPPSIDIFSHVTRMRSQRNYMVQSDDQYQFIHEAVLEAFEVGDTEVAADNLHSYREHLYRLSPESSGITVLDAEFNMLANMKIDCSKFITANLAVNKMKNRAPNVLPYESTRVCLQPIRGVDGSDYINANYIDSYRSRRAYIATQCPMVETRDDFWRMLWENNVSIIAMVTTAADAAWEKNYQYWPIDRSARYQYFVVDPVHQANLNECVVREFRMTDARDGQSRIIYQFQYLENSTEKEFGNGQDFINFIGQVENARMRQFNDGPIIVHCSTGAGRTGVFLALSIILERMKLEGLVDVFQTVRILKTQRHALVATEDQYAFCYYAAEEYLKSFDHYSKKKKVPTATLR